MIEIRKDSQTQRRGAFTVGEALSLDSDPDGLPRIGQRLLLRTEDGTAIRELVLDSSNNVVSVAWGLLPAAVAVGFDASMAVARPTRIRTAQATGMDAGFGVAAGSAVTP